MCGCGQQTTIAPYTVRAYGWVKGEPIRFVRNHHRRKPGPRWEVHPETGCWNWLRSKTNEGHGTVWVPPKRGEPGKYTLAHRAVYEDLVGPIPEGLFIDHLCRNRACVNPAHLEPVTPAENSRRGRGTRLTLAVAEAIRAADGSQRAIAARFGVSRSHVQQIRAGESWEVAA